MSDFSTGIPNIRVVIREAEDANLTLDVPNLSVKVEKNTDYNVNITPSVVVTLRTGSYNRFADVALLAYTASYVTASATAISASYAQTASYAINAGASVGFPFSGSAVITGSLLVSQSGITVTGSVNITDNLTVEGIISAEKLLVSSSVIYESGSTKFGDSSEDTHQFTGSILVQGPISASGITGSFKGDGSQLTGLVTDLRISGSTGSDTLNLLTDNLLITGSKGIAVAVTNNTVTIDVPTGLTASLYGTASVAEGIHIVSAGIYVTGSDSFIVPTPSGGFSIITSASYALTASYAANGGGGASDWNSITGKPAGLVSSSTQATSWTVATSSIATTASFAVTASYVAGAASTWNDITGKPAGLVSSSVQINTGSFSGSFTGSIAGTITSASFATTASAATSITFVPSTASFSTTSSFSVSSSRATTSSFSTTASYAAYAANADLLDGLNSTVFATTGSNTFSGNQIITGSFSVSSTASFNGPTTITDSIMGLTNSSSLVLTSGSSINVVSPGSITGSVVANALIIPTSAPASPQTGSIYFSGSFIYVYTGTQYRSASLA